LNSATETAVRPFDNAKASRLGDFEFTMFASSEIGEQSKF
jgi:hypothetical protein